VGTSALGVRRGFARAGQTARGAGGRARQAAASRWVEHLERFGYVVRGTLYIIVGVLAGEVALQAGGATTAERGAIRTIASLPFGKGLLLLTAVGLVGYGLWGFARAILDPLQRGSKPGGLLTRAGYLGSAWTYSALVVPAVQLLMGSTGGGQGNNGGAELIGRILAVSGGRVLVGLAGAIFVVGAGGGQLYEAATAHFKRDFTTAKIGQNQRRVVILVGRIGMGARGVVFTTMGGFLILAAVRADAVLAKGSAQALQTMAAQPQGQSLLGVVALGLICFGVYSMCCARWIRVR
jgi:hypothetical protein